MRSRRNLQGELWSFTEQLVNDIENPPAPDQSNAASSSGSALQEPEKEPQDTKTPEKEQSASASSSKDAAQVTPELEDEFVDVVEELAQKPKEMKKQKKMTKAGLTR